MGHLASLEHAGHFDLVPFFQESDRVPDQEAKIVLCDARTDLYTLNFLLLALLILSELALQILVLAVVDDLDHWRLGGWRDHHQIEPFISRDVQGLATLHDP